VLAKLPIDPALASACDSGCIEQFEQNWMAAAAGICETIGAM